MNVWHERAPGEWWHCQVGKHGPMTGSGNPPDSYVQFPADEQGKMLPEGCLHYYSLYNGAMPLTATDDEIDYLHICGKNGLDELIQSLTDLRQKIYGKS